MSLVVAGCWFRMSAAQCKNLIAGESLDNDLGSGGPVVGGLLAF